MLNLAFDQLLGQVPETTIYIHPLKLVATMLVFVIWAAFTQWVDKDTDRVNTFRVIWNIVFLSVGAVGLVVAIFVPNFVIGFPIYAVLVIALCSAYVIHRNGLVQPEDTVFTVAHMQRIQREGFSGKKKKKQEEVKERVRVTGADKKVVAIPEDEVEREQYRLTQDLLFDALWRRAELIEIAPAGQNSRLTYIIDGIPSEQDPRERTEGEGMVYYFKKIAGLDLEERRKPQKGELMIAVGENRRTIEVRTNGSTAGERLSLRVLGDETKYKVKDIGFNEKQMEQIRSIMETPRGVVLLSSPAKSGLTTTVYSFTRSHDAFLQNIQTLEYEREIEIENVTQHVHLPKDDRKFSDDVLKVIRTDPDIVVIPLLRDKESAGIIAKAGAEKHKIYIGLPANDVFEALKQWLVWVDNTSLAAKSLVAVVNQRLMRVLCTECKQPYKPDKDKFRKLNLPPDAVLYRQPEPEYDKHGNPIVCQHCQGSGYVGRTGVFEVLLIDDGMREVIRKATSMNDIKVYASKKAGLGLQPQAIEKVMKGITSIQEVVRVVRGKDAPKKTKPATGTPRKAAAKKTPTKKAAKPSPKS